MDQPINVHASSIFAVYLNLEWDTVVGSTYNVYKDGQLVNTAPISAYLEHFEVSELNPNTSYSFTVEAVRYEETSPLSEPLIVKTAPSTPTDVTISNATSESMTVSWTASVGGAASYSVHLVNTTQGNTFVDISSFNTTLELAALSPDCFYSISVIALNSEATPSFSTPTIYEHTLPPPLEAPQNLSITLLTSDICGLMWDSVYGAASYNIYKDGQFMLKLKD